MNHSEFDYYEDFTEPLKKFLNNIHFPLNKKNNIKKELNIPYYLFKTPKDVNNQN